MKKMLAFIVLLAGCGYPIEDTYTEPPTHRTYPHQRCGGNMVYQGEFMTLPSVSNVVFYVHACTLCGATNQIMNDIWPKVIK